MNHSILSFRTEWSEVKNLVDTHVYASGIFRIESSTTRLRFALNDQMRQVLLIYPSQEGS